MQPTSRSPSASPPYRSRRLHLKRPDNSSRLTRIPSSITRMRFSVRTPASLRRRRSDAGVRTENLDRVMELGILVNLLELSGRFRCKRLERYGGDAEGERCVGCIAVQGPQLP